MSDSQQRRTLTVLPLIALCTLLWSGASTATPRGLLSLVRSGTVSAQAARPERPRRLGPPPPKMVTRVVTLAPSLTETVLALGAGETLVGVSRFDELPEVAKLPRVGGFVDPSLEAVLALTPQLLLVQPAPGNQQPVEKLASLGVPILAVPLHRVEQVREALREIGALLGKAERAHALIQALEKTREEVRAKAATQRRPRTLIVYGFDPLVVAGPDSFAAELLADAGGENVVTGAKGAYPLYSVEAVIAAKPEFLLYSPAMAQGSEKLRRLASLKNVRFIALPSQDLLHPGPHLARGLTELYSLLHAR
ncbi:MAG: ABC transporter substrate-binding protein [Myxococcaceae bacterium]